MALMYILESIGIGGKLLRMIKSMYLEPKLSVRIGNNISDTANYCCGVRQGCPASPILFDYTLMIYLIV